MKKIILWISTLVGLWVIVSSGYYFGYNNEITNANADYICVKPAPANQACENVLWWEWQTDWTRVWIWTKVTEVAYYSTRISCEPWYTETHIWESSRASGRHGSDFTFSSETCTIIEKDDVAPVWAFK